MNGAIHALPIFRWLSEAIRQGPQRVDPRPEGSCLEARCKPNSAGPRNALLN